MPLATSEIRALKLGLSPLRILLPEREIRRRGIGSEGVTHSITPYFSSHLPCCEFIILRAYPALPLLSLTLLCLYFLRTPYFFSRSSSSLIPLFAYHLPCCAFIFLRTYSVPCCAFNFFSHLPCCAIIPLLSLPYPTLL